jgi:hypothetical protein
VSRPADPRSLLIASAAALSDQAAATIAIQLLTNCAYLQDLQCLAVQAVSHLLL